MWLIFLLINVARADWKWALLRHQELMRSQATASADPFFLSGNKNNRAESVLVDQWVDHADPSAGKFKQQIFIDDRFGKSSQSPVLLFLCGELKCEEGIWYGATENLAKKLGAHIIAIEHRYYGKSQPFSDLSTEHLKFLTTDQALEDLATLQDFIRTQKKWNGPWATIGTSYGGALAAYARAKMPDRFAAAWASSATVAPRLWFDELDSFIGSHVDVRCRKNVRSVLSQIESALKIPSRASSLRHEMFADKITDDRDFIYVMADLFAWSFQSGISDQLCEKLNEQPTIETYASYGISNLVRQGIVPYDDSYQATQDTTILANADSMGQRQWVYLTCTEFGFFQSFSRDPRYRLRPRTINRQFFREQCQNIFGIKKLRGRIHTAIRALYDPVVAQQDRIYFVNSELDPWRLLSVDPYYSRNPPGYPMIVVPGGHHGSDLNPTTQAASQVADIVENKMQEWLTTPAH